MSQNKYKYSIFYTFENEFKGMSNEHMIIDKYTPIDSEDELIKVQNYIKNLLIEENRSVKSLIITEWRELK